MSIVQDVIFYSSALGCICLGSQYRQIPDADTKKNCATALGLLLSCIICGKYCLHGLAMVAVNTYIIKNVDKRHVFWYSLLYTWSHLILIEMTITYSIYVIWLHQTLALRMAGLAFETSHPELDFSADVTFVHKTDTEFDDADLSSLDIASYAFCFIGLHKGPYYRFKVYDDYFKYKFTVLADCRVITEQKLKKAAVYGSLGIFLYALFPTSAYIDEYFYKECSWIYRYLYNIPTLMIFFFRNIVMAMLSTSICTEVGFGLFPVKCRSIPAYGPTTEMDILAQLAGPLENNIALQEELNFAMLRCYDLKRMIAGPTLVQTMKGWDMPTRYWFMNYIYKNIRTSNKPIRSAIAMTIWVLWYAPTFQHLLFSITVWFYVNLEEEFKSFITSKETTYNIACSVSRILFMFYLTPCFAVILDASSTAGYYNSILWFCHIFAIIAAIWSFAMCKSLEGVERTPFQFSGRRSSNIIEHASQRPDVSPPAVAPTPPPPQSPPSN